MNSSRQLIKRIRSIHNARNWKPASLGSLAKSIMIEGAELLEHFQWSDRQGQKLTSQQKQDITDEFADVCIYALQMCEQLDVDIEDIVQSKLEKVQSKYPAEIVKNNSEAYKEIKQAFRDKKNTDRRDVGKV